MGIEKRRPLLLLHEALTSKETLSEQALMYTSKQINGLGDFRPPVMKPKVACWTVEPIQSI